MIAPTDQTHTCSRFARTRGDYRLRVIVADGSLHYMESVLAVLELHAIVDLVGRAANFEETLELVMNHQPDVVLVDLAMPLVNLIVPAVILSTRAAVKVVGMYDVALPWHANSVMTLVDALIRKENVWQEFVPVVGTLYGWHQPVSHPSDSQTSQIDERDGTRKKTIVGIDNNRWTPVNLPSPR